MAKLTRAGRVALMAPGACGSLPVKSSSRWSPRLVMVSRTA